MQNHHIRPTFEANTSKSVEARAAWKRENCWQPRPEGQFGTIVGGERKDSKINLHHLHDRRLSLAERMLAQSMPLQLCVKVC